VVGDIYLNGKYIGKTDNPEKFVQEFRKKRRLGYLPETVNIYLDEQNDIYIYTDGGRIVRPLIVVENGKPKLTQKHIELLAQGKLKWDDLVKQGIIEYLDAAEEENAYIALDIEDLTPEHTHLEIGPQVILGILSAAVPYARFNQSARLNRGERTQRQALGLYSVAYPLRFESDVHVAQTLQKPLVRTIVHDLIRFDERPAGYNMVVAVMAYEGYNTQDALVINRNAIDFGFTRTMYFRPYEAVERKYALGLSDEITVPSPDVRGYKGEKHYRHLESDGIVYPEAEVKGKDVLIGRISPPRFLEGGELALLGAATLQKRDSSITVRSEEEGIVDSVLVTEGEDSNLKVRVRIRMERPTEIGDKFSSRHGQKGVIGLIVPPSDMPFTASGIVPDLIFNPHGLPSRMTIGQIIELVAGKVASLRGKAVDGTPWEEEPVEDLRKQLLRLGFREDGTETMYDPITGEEYKVKIFVGVMWYHKLKFLAANKLHARARGPMAILTRQPTEGKSREGGLRFGEMETDVILSHGAAISLYERFGSDLVKVPVCEKCGAIAIENKEKGTAYCPVCGETEKISYVEMSYAFKLFLDELTSLGIWPRLRLKHKFD